MQRQESGEQTGIPDNMKAGWAVAYANHTRNRELGPALRKAYKRDEPPDREAMQDALMWAKCIVSALERGLEMLGDA